MLDQLESRIVKEVEEREFFRKQLKTYRDPQLVKLYTDSDDKLSILSLEVVKFTSSFRIIEQKIQDRLLGKRSSPPRDRAALAANTVTRWKFFRSTRPPSRRLRFPPPVPRKVKSGEFSDSTSTGSMTLEPLDTGRSLSSSLATSNGELDFLKDSDVASKMNANRDDLNQLSEYSKWRQKTQSMTNQSTDLKHIFDTLEISLVEDLRGLFREKTLFKEKLKEQKASMIQISNQRNYLDTVVREKDKRIAELEQQVIIYSREKVNAQERSNVLENNVRFFEFKYQEQHQYISVLEGRLNVSGKGSKQQEIDALKQKAETEVKIQTMQKQVHVSRSSSYFLRFKNSCTIIII